MFFGLPNPYYNARLHYIRLSVSLQGALGFGGKADGVGVQRWSKLLKIILHEYDRSQKFLLEFKASLIAAKAVRKGSSSELVLARYFKNIQPISVGV